MPKKGIMMAGAAMLLLPFLVNPYGPDQQAQIDAAKLIGVFLFGNIALAALTTKELGPVLAIIHVLYAASCVATGFGWAQLYPFCYWTACMAFSVWFLQQPYFAREWVWKCVFTASIASSLYAFMQKFGIDPIFSYAPGIDRTLPIAFFGQYTKFGAYAAPIAAMMASWGGVWCLGAAVVGAACVVTTSSFTVAALLAGLTVALGRKYHKQTAAIAVTGLAIAVLGCIFFPKAEIFYAQGRYEIWDASIKAWFHHRPWFGFGPGSYQIVFPRAFQPKTTMDHGAFIQAHNDYINLIFETGVIGVAIILIALSSVGLAFYRFWWRKDLWVPRETKGAMAYLAAIMVNAIGNFPFQQGPHNLLATMCFAILLKELREWRRI